MKRRTFIRNSGVVLAAAAVPGFLQAAKESPLIYISPLKSNGDLSACQAEVWFVENGGDFYVVTAADAWRAQAITQGLHTTQIWVGDVGQWQSADGRYKSLPSIRAQGAQLNEKSEHARLLPVFGNKYVDEWGTWGPRFKRGLADGSRVLLRYTPA